jgi:hypothetical protein
MTLRRLVAVMTTTFEVALMPSMSVSSWSLHLSPSLVSSGRDGVDLVDEYDGRGILLGSFERFA